MCCYGQLVTDLMQSIYQPLFSICWVQFSPSVVSVSLQRHGLQHARLPYPSPTLGAYSSSCPSTWWCHPTISSCLPLLFLPSMFPTSGSFSMNQFFPSGRQIIGASTSASVLPVNIQDWFFFRMDLFYPLAVQGTLKSLIQCHSLKGIYVCHLSVMSCSPCWDLTTRTEFKQHEKMRTKSQWPI